MDNLRRLIREIHRRSLWQVLLIYLGASYGVLEAAGHVVDRFAMPEWVYGGTVLLLLVGLPIVLATAFIQEGIRDDAPGVAEAEALPALRPSATMASNLFTWRNAISGGVLAMALWGVVSAGWLVFGAGMVPVGDEPETPTVAVLPFTTAAVAADDADFFAGGLHDELLTRLSKISGLSVISRTSVVRYADSELGIPEIGRQLGAAAVVEGGVQRTSDRIRVNVQLIDARTDEHIWAETYDRSLSIDNIFEIQAEVAQRVASELRVQLTPEEANEIGRRTTESLDAYEVYLQGRNHFNRRFQVAEALRAIELFEEARTIDPEFAAAYAMEAQTRIWLYWFQGAEDQLEPAREALERAEALDADALETRVARGMYLYRIEGDYGAALDYFLEVLEQAPGDSEIVGAAAAVQRRLGMWEAAADGFVRVVEQNPASPDDAFTAGQTFRLMRRPEEALRYFERTISLDPSHVRARVGRSWALIGLQEDTASAEAALRDVDEELRREVRAQVIQHAPEGNPAYYRRAFDESIELRRLTGPAFILGLDFWAAGRRDEAAIVGDSLRYYSEVFLEEEGDAISRLQRAGALARAGLGYALAGRAAEAREAGDRAMEVVPSSYDAFYGPRVEWTRMLIALILGDHDDALDRLEVLVSIPSEAHHGFLKLDPLFDPVRDDPRFQELVRRVEAAVR